MTVKDWYPLTSSQRLVTALRAVKPLATCAIEIDADDDIYIRSDCLINVFEPLERALLGSGYFVYMRSRDLEREDGKTYFVRLQLVKKKVRK